MNKEKFMELLLNLKKIVDHDILDVQFVTANNQKICELAIRKKSAFYHPLISLKCLCNVAKKIVKS